MCIGGKWHRCLEACKVGLAMNVVLYASKSHKIGTRHIKACLNQFWIAQIDYVFALLIPHSLQLCCIEN